jgi:hypothetical protein
LTMTNQVDFMDRVLRGDVANPDQAIFMEIDAWHESDSKKSLADWLGLDDEEYKAWVSHPKRLNDVIEAHRLRNSAWPEPPKPARLPDGWVRVYEPHWSCSAYTLYYYSTTVASSTEHIAVCAGGISFTHQCDHLELSREDWDALMGAVRSDYESFVIEEELAIAMYGDIDRMTPQQVLDLVFERKG